MKKQDYLDYLHLPGKLYDMIEENVSRLFSQLDIRSYPVDPKKMRGSYTYETVGKIDGVKVLQKNDKKSSSGLPEEAHSSSAYILEYGNGAFKQMRFYNADHTAMFDIDYHYEPKLGGRKEPVYHIHEYRNGVREKTEDR